MFSRIDHVGVVVADIASSQRWYEDQLGWTPTDSEYLDSVGVHLCYLRSPDGDDERTVTFLQLVQPVGPGPILDFLNQRGEGLHHVCFAADNLHLALGRMGEDSVRPFVGGRNRLACFLEATPNGVLIELTEVAPSRVG